MENDSVQGRIRENRQKTHSIGTFIFYIAHLKAPNLATPKTSLPAGAYLMCLSAETKRRFSPNKKWVWLGNSHLLRYRKDEAFPRPVHSFVGA